MLLAPPFTEIVLLRCNTVHFQSAVCWVRREFPQLHICVVHGIDRCKSGNLSLDFGQATRQRVSLCPPGTWSRGWRSQVYGGIVKHHWLSLRCAEGWHVCVGVAFGIVCEKRKLCAECEEPKNYAAQIFTSKSVYHSSLLWRIVVSLGFPHFCPHSPEPNDPLHWQAGQTSLNGHPKICNPGTLINLPNEALHSKMLFY